MPELKSLTQILKEGGIKDVSIEDLSRLKAEGKIRSAYSNVVSSAEFDKIRFGPLADVESSGEYTTLITGGLLSLTDEPLGVVLESVNFYGNTTVREMWYDGVIGRLGLGDAEQKAEAYDKQMERFKTVGVDPARSFAWLSEFFYDSRELMAGVKTWYAKDSKRTDWNPSYAKPIRNKAFYEQKGVASSAWLNSWSQHSIGREKFSGGFVLPFDGWTLAECFRISYETKSLKSTKGGK